MWRSLFGVVPTHHYRFLYHEVDAADCYLGWERHASFFTTATYLIEAVLWNDESRLSPHWVRP